MNGKEVFKKMHIYRLRKQFKKTSKYINEIMPIEDIEVPYQMFIQYEDQAGKVETKE